MPKTIACSQCGALNYALQHADDEDEHSVPCVACKAPIRVQRDVPRKGGK